MTIQDLLEAASEPTPPPPPPTGFAAILAAAEAEPLNSMTIDMAIGEALCQIVITEIRGHEWAHTRDLAGPPRQGVTADYRLGCNAYAFLTGYPVASIAADGANPTEAQWGQLCALMGATTHDDLIAALWWMHIGEPQQNLAALMAVGGQHGK